MTTWRAEDAPPAMRIGPLGWILALARGLILAVIVFGGLAILLILRQIEKPVHSIRQAFFVHHDVAGSTLIQNFDQKRQKTRIPTRQCACVKGNPVNAGNRSKLLIDLFRGG